MVTWSSTLTNKPDVRHAWQARAQTKAECQCQVRSMKYHGNPLRVQALVSGGGVKWQDVKKDKFWRATVGSVSDSRGGRIMWIASSELQRSQVPICLSPWASGTLARLKASSWAPRPITFQRCSPCHMSKTKEQVSDDIEKGFVVCPGLMLKKSTRAG